MAAPTKIASAAQWETIMKSHNIVIADCKLQIPLTSHQQLRSRQRANGTRPVYADWCGPCKMIAPHFERLSKENSEPKRVAFVKVDVDNQQSIAQTHGVRAMPTFIIFHCGKAINTIKGANPPALSSAIAEALKLKGQGTPGEYFRTAGRTLGGDGQASATAPVGLADFQGIINGVLLFVGLYIVSLLSARVSEWLQARKEE